MVNKQKNKRSIFIISGIAMVIIILAAGLAGTFAMNAKNKEWIEFEQPLQSVQAQGDDTYHLLENAEGIIDTFTVGGATASGWKTSDKNIAKISTGATIANGIVTPVKAGNVTIVVGNQLGATRYRNYQIYDNGNIVKYQFNDGRSANMKNINDTVEMNDKITTENGHGVSVDSSILWESWGEEVASVTQTGTVTAIAEGTAIIVGKIIDKWGIEQIIPFSVTVGSPVSEDLGDDVVKVGEDYYRPVSDEEGNPSGVWEKTDSSGEESTDIYVGGNEQIPNPFDPLYKIQPQDNEEEPPASGYSNTYEGYLTTMPEGTSEYDQWQNGKGVIQVDKSSLKDAIDTAEGMNESEYDPGLWGTLQEKLVEANNVYNNPDATQEEVDEAERELRSAISALGILTIDSEVTFGKDLGGNNLEWRVLDIDVENGKALLITTTVATECIFHTKTPYPTWGLSNIRNFLKTTFYNTCFTSEEKGKILETDVVTAKSYKSSETETTKDYLFLLSEEEILRYLPKAGSRIPKTTKMGDRSGTSSNATSWGYNRYWLRNPKGTANNAAYINNSGAISGYTVIYGQGVGSTNRNQGGVRPAMWVDLDKF